MDVWNGSFILGSIQNYSNPSLCSHALCGIQQDHLKYMSITFHIHFESSYSDNTVHALRDEEA